MECSCLHCLAARATALGDRRGPRITKDFEIIPGFPGLVGAWFDLQCVPLADESSRFASHGDYIQRVVRQASALHESGFLLQADAVALIQQAAESEVGNPNTCAR